MIDSIKEIITYQFFQIQGKSGQIPVTPIFILKILLFILVAWFLSKRLQKLLRNRVFSKTSLDPGITFTILRIIHYLIMAIVLYQAITMIGLDLKGLAFIAGILSLGIGFGLQNIASNFVSGLIMMFERPVKVNDVVTVGGMDGTIADIRMRSTTISTFDNISVIVPNTDFITGHVVNWSHGDPKIRVRIPIGVAYGSNVELVTQILLNIAREHPLVLDAPEPEVFFTEFGESSLNFELAVWLPSPAKRKRVVSDINYAIDARFRENGVEIPFPQRDLHLRSVDRDIGAIRLLNAGKEKEDVA